MIYLKMNAIVHLQIILRMVEAREKHKILEEKLQGFRNNNQGEVKQPEKQMTPLNQIILINDGFIAKYFMPKFA